MMLLRSNSAIPGFEAKAEPHSPTYKRVAEITMQAIEAMPPEFQALVQEFGYVDVYRAWRRRWTPEQIRDAARHNDGFFKL